MGLDTVELVLEIEDYFQVDMPDEVAGMMQTVGDVYHYLVSQFPAFPSSTCKCAAVFYQIRRTLCGEFAFLRQQVRPSSETVHFFPAEFRNDAWARFQETLQFDLPQLHG